MDWILYILLTIIFYLVSVVQLKPQTEKERIGSTRIFFRAIIFFLIFEYVFIDSIFQQVLFHLLGLFLSISYSLSLYFYLKAQKKKIDIIFNKMLKQTQGRISVLSFMQATQLSQNEVQNYLNKKLEKLNGSRSKTPGNIYYQFDKW
jgi:hypothetical protein